MDSMIKREHGKKEEKGKVKERIRKQETKTEKERKKEKKKERKNDVDEPNVKRNEKTKWVKTTKRRKVRKLVGTKERE